MRGEESKARAARITSAVQLTEEERSRLEQSLGRRFGDDLQFEYRVDDSILGGVIVRVGDRVIDGSVASKLAALRERLKQGG
ncbi:MAG: ATP synthase subunit delta [Anaerolineales bacterium]|nr:ATP synthase subunit delta [Anaerolineales bacterium]